MKFKYFFLILLLILFSISSSAQVIPKFRFVGVKKCKHCHKKASRGNQFRSFENAKHSRAYEVLATDKAKTDAWKMGEIIDPQNAKECLICHASNLYDEKGNEQPWCAFGKRYRVEDGVQCETCHGPGDKYSRVKFKKLIVKEGGADKSMTAKRVGLFNPTKKHCLRCHVPELTIGGKKYINPHYKEFNFKKLFEKIKHKKSKK